MVGLPICLSVNTKSARSKDLGIWASRSHSRKWWITRVLLATPSGHTYVWPCAQSLFTHVLSLFPPMCTSRWLVDKGRQLHRCTDSSCTAAPTQMQSMCSRAWALAVVVVHKNGQMWISRLGILASDQCCHDKAKKWQLFGSKKLIRTICTVREAAGHDDDII